VNDDPVARSWKSRALGAVNRVIEPLGFKLARSGSAAGYIPASEVVPAARAAGLDANEYLERSWPGFRTRAAEALDDFLARRPALAAAQRPLRVCEIGPGSGRMIELVRARLPVAVYRVYEIDKGWRRYLAETYSVEAPACDGRSVAGEPDGSVDLAHAHAIFVYLPVLLAIEYLRDLGRALTPGGVLWFDLFTEDDMTEAEAAIWLATPHRYPVVWPRRLLDRELVAAGLRLTGELPSRVGIGTPRYLVAEKTGV
jgi:SAM-dependent methyltransferase